MSRFIHPPFDVCFLLVIYATYSPLVSDAYHCLIVILRTVRYWEYDEDRRGAVMKVSGPALHYL